MAQEEEGHAAVLEGLLRELGEATRGRQTLVTWERWAGSTAANEQPHAAWPNALADFVAREASTTSAIAALGGAADRRVVERTRKMLQEERFHRSFGLESLRALTLFGAEARARLALDYRAARASEPIRARFLAGLVEAASGGAVSPEAPGEFEARVAAADREVLAAIEGASE
jgi:1,2-phenylacetyl-CoA epoxidase catalytic subunit